MIISRLPHQAMRFQNFFQLLDEISPSGSSSDVSELCRSPISPVQEPISHGDSIRSAQQILNDEDAEQFDSKSLSIPDDEGLNPPPSSTLGMHSLQSQGHGNRGVKVQNHNVKSGLGIIFPLK